MSGLASAEPLAMRYDVVSMLLHWLVALLVVVQFALAMLWDFPPKPIHHLMVVTHMSLGVIFSGVLLIRLMWRFALRHEVEDLTKGLVRVASRVVHYALYLLLVLQVALGFLWPWTENHPLNFFGFPISSPFGAFPKGTNDIVAELHDLNAWVIIILAGGHAAMALIHQFVFRDRILRIMLPEQWIR